MKYKVGDKVRIKSLKWYSENSNISGDIAIGDTFFRDFMSRFCGSVVTIESIELVAGLLCYRIKEDGRHYCWVDEMIEGLVEDETKPLTYEETVEIIEAMQGIGDSWECPQGYQFVDENGNVINASKIVLEKKKKEYPKTFEECVHVLEGENRMSLELMNTFRKLIDARNAYWKIAGEKMGLGKPWEPDWDNVSDKYCIYFVSGYAWSKECQTRQCPFAFPTPEMRDAFKENFDQDLEICKEFL